jgi:repressor LexA
MQLTKKQFETLEAIESFIKGNGFSPSIRDLVGALGLASPAPVQSRLEKLKKAGVISMQANLSRSISVSIPSTDFRFDGRCYCLPLARESKVHEAS